VRYTRVYTDERGESRFEDVELATEARQAVESDLVAEISAGFDVRGAYFRRPVTEASPVPHNAPYPLFIVMLRGRCSIEASDGETREFGPGEVVLVEDTTGKGHTTRRVGDEPRLTLMLPLAR
jgi:quercetin dioxygenase-like cupin family protein